MSTRSYIVLDDGKQKLSYRFHHWDGYIDGVGETLQRVFTKPEDVHFLFKQEANIDTLNTTEEAHNIRIAEAKKELAITPNKYNFTLNELEHYSHIPYKGQILKFYKGEKPEEVKKQKVSSTNIFSKCDEEYTYVYKEKENRWLVSPYKTPFMPLKEALFFIHLIDKIKTITTKDCQKYNISQKSNLTKKEEETNNINTEKMFADSKRTGQRLLQVIKQNKENALDIYHAFRELDKDEKDALVAAYSAKNLQENHEINLDLAGFFTSYIESNLMHEKIKKTTKKHVKVKL